jgi:hypothetical protein
MVECYGKTRKPSVVRLSVAQFGDAEKSPSAIELERSSIKSSHARAINSRCFI